MNIVRKLSFRKDIKRHIIESHTDLYSIIEVYDIDKAILFNNYCIEQKYNLAFHIYATYSKGMELEADPILFRIIRLYCKYEYQLYNDICNANIFDEEQYESVCNIIHTKIHNIIDSIYE